MINLNGAWAAKDNGKVADGSIDSRDQRPETRKMRPAKRPMSDIPTAAANRTKQRKPLRRSRCQTLALTRTSSK